MPDQETIVEIQGRKLKLTRLDKVMYPAVHFTKAEVIDYYLRVSPFILPHLKDRPLTLKRFPNGVKGEAYWDKDVPSFAPSWVRTFPVPRHAGGPDINYLLINDTATLVWAANAAALELHPFLHKAPAITVPTWIVLDLDPGEGADILTCAEVAFLIKKTMDRLGLQLFPKVSGSKGIQLYIPLNTDVTYDVTQPFARAVAQWIEKERPDIAVSEMPKIKRTGKVFIDWSQNSDYKTTAGVYSLRAKQDRPLVSMPVQWEELRSALKRKKADGLAFEPKTALDRLEKIGDLFAPVLTLKQTLPPEFTDAMGPPAKTRTTVRKAGGSASQAALPRRSAQGGTPPICDSEARRKPAAL